MWALFSGMFNRYQKFYHLTYFLIPLFMIYPCKKFFGKVIKEHKWHEGMLSFICGFVLFVGYFHFSYITIYELSLMVTLAYTGAEYVFKINILIIINYTAAFILGLTSMLTGLWFYSVTGNPNFNFF